jgi:hypothetical protein
VLKNSYGPELAKIRSERSSRFPRHFWSLDFTPLTLQKSFSTATGDNIIKDFKRNRDVTTTTSTAVCSLTVQRKTLSILVGVVVGAFVLCAAIWLAPSALLRSWTEVIGDVPSPDGKWDVVLMVRNAGAVTDYSTPLSVVPTGRLSREIALYRPGNVFIADGNHGTVAEDHRGFMRVDVLWKSPNLLEITSRQVTFVAERFFSVRASWADLRDLWRNCGRDLAVLGPLVLGIAVMLLAIFAIPYLLWKEVRRKAQKNSSAEPPRSFAGQVRHLVEVAILSAFIGSAATAAVLVGRPVIGIPGWWAARTLNLDVLGLPLLLAVVAVVNSAISFAILWGGHLLWSRWRTHTDLSALRRPMLVGD